MKLLRKKQKKHLFYNIKIFTLFIAVIMIWRWVWNFLDYYLFPEFFIISNLLTIVIWLLIFFIHDYDLDDI